MSQIPIAELETDPLVQNSAVQATTSGTSIDFTGVPAGVKKVTINLEAVSTSGTSAPIIQIGDSGGIETSGYHSNSSSISTGVSTVYSAAGYIINSGNAGAVFRGTFTLSLLDESLNTWCISGVIGDSNLTKTIVLGGAKSLSAVLDRVRLTTVGGTDTFDLGNAAISWEF